MPSNAGSVGVDYAFGYYDGNTSSLVDLGDVQSVKISALKHDIANRRYNGVPRFDFIPDGYKITFSITRTTAALENLAVLRESNFNQGIGSATGYLSETVTNTDGSINRYQYTGFVWFLIDHGDISREKVVTIAGEGMASQKVQIS